MARTTEVRIGEFKMPISGPAAEALDQYNTNDNTFSPEDIREGGVEAEEEAIEILSNAIGFYDISLKGKIEALVHLSDETAILLRQVRRLSELKPHFHNQGNFFKDELEFDAKNWKEAGGAGSVRGVVFAAEAVGDAFDSVKNVFPELFSSSWDNAWRATDIHYTLFRPVFEGLASQLNEARDFFHVRMGPGSANSDPSCQYAFDIECEGPGCPKEDEVSGHFCIPTFR